MMIVMLIIIEIIVEQRNPWSKRQARQWGGDMTCWEASETTEARRHSLGGESGEQRRGQSPGSSGTFRGAHQGEAASSTVSIVMEMFRGPPLGAPSS